MKKIKIKNMGFTLIELLVTIVIMISILSLAIISYNNISKAKKEDAYTSVKNQVESAAREYFYANEYKFEEIANGDKNSFKTVSLKDLVDSGYITSVTDPKTGKKLGECAIVTVTKNSSGKFEFRFDENKKFQGADSNSGTCQENTTVVLSAATKIKTLTATFYKNNTQDNSVSSIGGDETKSSISISCNTTKLKPNSCSITTPTITAGDYYGVLGWGKDSTLKSKDYDINQIIEISADISLHAITYRNVFTAYFNGNYSTDNPVSGISKSSDSCKIESYDDSCTIKTAEITAPDGYHVLGWKKGTSGEYNIPQNSDLTLNSTNNGSTYYAGVNRKAFQPKTLTATFYKNNTQNNSVSSIGDDDTKSSISISCNTKESQPNSCSITTPTITAGNYYGVLGWGKESNLKSKDHDVNESIEISADISLYAITYRNVFTAYFNGNYSTDNPVSGISKVKDSCDIKSYGASCTIKTAQITAPDGYHVLGWKKGTSGEYDIPQNSDLTLNSTNSGSIYYAGIQRDSKIKFSYNCEIPGKNDWCVGNMVYEITRESENDTTISSIVYKIDNVENTVNIDNVNHVNNDEYSVESINDGIKLTYKKETKNVDISFYGILRNGNHTDSSNLSAKIDKTPPIITINTGRTGPNKLDSSYQYVLIENPNDVNMRRKVANYAYINVLDEISGVLDVYHDDLEKNNAMVFDQQYSAIASLDNPVTIFAEDNAGNLSNNNIKKPPYSRCGDNDYSNQSPVTYMVEDECAPGVEYRKKYLYTKWVDKAEYLYYSNAGYEDEDNPAYICSERIDYQPDEKCPQVELDETPPTLTVLIYKREDGLNDASDYENKTPIYHLSYSGTGNSFALNMGNWLNNNEYPYGVYFRFYANEKLKNEKFYWNKGVLTEENAKNNSNKWQNETAGYNGGGLYSWNNVNEGISQNNTWISDDGYRYIKIMAKDMQGNTTDVTFDVPIDKVGPSIQNITSPYVTKNYCNNNNAMYTSFKVSDSLSGVNFVNHYLYNVKTVADYDEILNSASFISVKDGEVNNDTNGSQYMNFFNPSTTVSNGVFTIKRAWMYGSLTTARKNGCGTRGSLNVGSGAYCNYVASSDKAGNRAVARYGSCKPKE